MEGPTLPVCAEMKGGMWETGVYPGQSARWWFVPVQAGRFSDLRRTIAGHAAGGMVGAIAIQAKGPGFGSSPAGTVR